MSVLIRVYPRLSLFWTSLLGEGRKNRGWTRIQLVVLGVGDKPMTPYDLHAQQDSEALPKFRIWTSKSLRFGLNSQRAARPKVFRGPISRPGVQSMTTANPLPHNQPVRWAIRAARIRNEIHPSRRQSSRRRRAPGGSPGPDRNHRRRRRRYREPPTDLPCRRSSPDLDLNPGLIREGLLHWRDHLLRERHGVRLRMNKSRYASRN